MIKIIALVIMLLCSGNIRTQVGMVTDVADEAYIITGDGHVWSVDAEDWQPYDMCSIVFDTKGTNDATDDEIIWCRYNCTIEYFEKVKD